MTSTLILAPPSTGKTQHCVELVRATCTEHPGETVWVLLPDHRRAIAFRHQMMLAGGALGARITPFTDFYKEALIRAGRARQLISDAAALRLVRSATNELFERGELSAYAAIHATPGFILSLYERFIELERAHIRPSDLLSIVPAGDQGAIELARLYAAYLDRLDAVGWTDAEKLSWLAVDELERDPSWLTNLPLVVVDGFDEFSSTQIMTLRLIAAHTPRLFVTLPGEPGMARRVHRRFAYTLEALRRAINFEIVALEGKTHLPTPLAHLERGLFQPEAGKVSGRPNLTLIEARAPADEAREALRWLKARLLRDGLPPGACAIVTPDPSLYHPVLRQTAQEFGLPLSFSQPELLISAPAVAAVIDLLSLPVEDYPRRALIDTLRSPYFDLSAFGLFPEMAKRFEIAGRTGQVVGSLRQWLEALDRLAGTLEESFPSDEDGAWPSLPRGEAARQMADGLRRLAERLSPFSALSTADWVDWVEKLLSEIKFFERTDAGQDRIVRDSFYKAMRSLCQADILCPTGKIPYPYFLSELMGLLRGSNLPSGENQTASIQVLRFTEVRGLRFQALALLGLAEGLFPELERPDPFLNEDLRGLLGLEPRLGREQTSLFYQAVTRSDRSLLLTRPYLSPDGETWEPSPYWNAACALLSEKPWHIRPDDPRPLADAASPQELLFWAAQRDSLPPEFLPDFHQHWEELNHSRAFLSARLARDPSTHKEGDLQILSSELAERFGSGYPWSPTQLETYGVCPYRFFVEMVLLLEAVEEPQTGFDARQLGSMLHRILEQAYRMAASPGDAQSVILSLNEVAPRTFAEAPERYGFRPDPLWAVQQEQLLRSLQRSVERLAETGKGWTPLAFELVFGYGSAPALYINTTTRGPVLLRGVIDRVDRDSAGRVRIIDYKIGGSRLSAADLLEGERLQLPLYALAARDALRLGQIADGLYWSVLPARAGSLRLERFKGETGGIHFQGVEGAAAVAALHVERIINGVQSGEFPPLPPQSGCPAYCAAARWCWHYRPSNTHF